MIPPPKILNNLGLPKDSDLITKEELTVVDSHGEKVKGMREVLSRDHMKVAFFGR